MAPPDPSAVGALPTSQMTSLDASVGVGAPLGTPLGTPHAPLSWGYPAWNTPVAACTPVSMAGGMPGGMPGPRVSVKRALSESEDCDDVFSEDSASKDQCSADGDEADSCQLLSRKKRRGVIEKRRRDRINTSLTELRRLVPTAFEKQGSAKLEKAEILQMTVDHLKVLHAKGMDALAYDPQRFAMDYHNIGFRECAAEVARYLVTVEGLDIQDPLRLRLMSHLQCFAAQRELASKQAASATCTPTHASGSHTFPTPPSSGHSHHMDNSPTNSSTTSSSHGGGGTGGHHYDQHTPTSCEQTPTSTSTRHSTSPLTPLSASAAGSYPPTSPGPGHPHPYYPSQYPYHHHQNAFNHGAVGAGAKPYRPWGAEVAY
ncbi:hypothetical protein ONE63_000305 [Megalurothrips usitatus]|uniref:Hairy/enhancer-of-split related with YRPW motif protein n=1 Tax=Megalurothrips usitatus TaxID=439358 RepID=A0AAV7Y115_9NEOP|nr:hypothetical protein ONE63_000305 [Megalurothrips usitatus]